MHKQVWIGGSVASLLLLVSASEWVQLHMVEPSGKINYKQTSCDNEQDFQIQSPEANKRTDEAERKVETLKHVTQFPSVRISDTFTDQFTGNRINMYDIENDQSGTQSQNSKLYLHQNEHVFTPPIQQSHYLKPNTESNYRIQMPKEMVTLPQLSYKLPLESVLETEGGDTKTPHSKEHLTSSNFNTTNYLQRPDLEITTMQADAKLPTPVMVNHHSDVTNSVSKFSHTIYETKTTPYSTVKKNNENPEEIGTSSELNVSCTAAHSETSRLPGTGNSNTKEENTAQDTNLPIDMLRAVHKTLIPETSHIIRGKMLFLQQLKDKMLHYIGTGFNTSDLLIQQLIQGLQANNTAKMSMRHSRSLPDLLTTARVLQLIDNFPLKYEDNGWT